MKNTKNVIKFLHYQKVSQEKFVIITERPQNAKDMFDTKADKPFPYSEEDCKKVIRKLVSVARDIEKKGFAHRDIKIENILYNVDTGEIKLIDFGLARAHSPGELFKVFAGAYS